jgi:N-acetyl-anhydromuramyl-L-alanine amidase AmpD
MNIDKDHWVDTALRVPLAGGSWMPVRRFLVMHFTSGASAMSSINFWKSPEAQGASAHFVIDRDGTLYQCRPCNTTCGHAGKSSWKEFRSLNTCSIGIEFANAGDSADLIKRWSKLPALRAQHKNGGSVREWERYTPEQINTGKLLAQVLVKRYKLDAILGHDDIAPDRKVDPGPAFPMAEIRRYCGFAS